MEQINNKKEEEISGLRKELETERIQSQTMRKDLGRAKAMYEGLVQRQQNNLYGLTPTQKYEMIEKRDQRKDEEFNERLIRTLGLIRWQGEEPAWYKIQFLDRSRKINPKDSDALRAEYARMIICKKELAERLNKVEGVLKITAEAEKKREDEHLILKKRKENELLRLEETRKELQSSMDRIGVNTGKVFIGKNQRTGEDVFYNDGISVFSLDKSDLFRVGTEENILDLYLDKIDLEPGAVVAGLEAVHVAGVYPQNLVTVMAVNFFNHPTLTSQKCFGTKADIKLQCAFAFRCDGLFIEYCKANTLDVDIFFTNEHGFQVKFAVAAIELNKLLEANLIEKREDYIGVVNTYARVHTLTRQHIGVITFRMKTRLPIYRDLVNYNMMHRGPTDGAMAAYDSKYLNTERTLNIKICNGYGFSAYSRTFVSYKFLSQLDTITKIVEGANPLYDQTTQHSLVYTHGVRDFIRKDRIEFTVYDDSVPYKQNMGALSDGTLRDVVGSGQYVDEG